MDISTFSFDLYLLQVSIAIASALGTVILGICTFDTKNVKAKTILIITALLLFINTTSVFIDNDSKVGTAKVSNIINNQMIITSNNHEAIVSAKYNIIKGDTVGVYKTSFKILYLIEIPNGYKIKR